MHVYASGCGIRAGFEAEPVFVWPRLSAGCENGRRELIDNDGGGLIRAAL